MMGRFWREKSLVQEKSLKASEKKIIMHGKKKKIMHRKNARFSLRVSKSKDLDQILKLG